jgi:ribosomal protein S2
LRYFLKFHFLINVFHFYPSGFGGTLTNFFVIFSQRRKNRLQKNNKRVELSALSFLSLSHFPTVALTASGAVDFGAIREFNLLTIPIISLADNSLLLAGGGITFPGCC